MPLKLLCHPADPHIVIEMKSSREMKLYANVRAEFLAVLFRTSQSWIESIQSKQCLEPAKSTPTYVKEWTTSTQRLKLPQKHYTEGKILHINCYFIYFIFK